jgi:transposase
VDVREILNAIFYWADSGCKWKLLPHDFPPSSTVFEYFSNMAAKGYLAKDK